MRLLSEEDCISSIVQDIQKKYQLPRNERTIVEMITKARRKSGVEKLRRHDIMAQGRFDPEVQHMIVFKVLSDNCIAGD